MYEVYFDGACEPINPAGVAAFGFVIKKNGEIIAQQGKIIGQGKGMTNNVAEYYGLIEALKFLLNLKINEPIKIYTDSNLVVNIINKNWGWNRKKTCWQPHKKTPHLKKLLEKALKLLNNFRYQLLWIPREKNQLADQLSKKSLIKAGIKIKN